MNPEPVNTEATVDPGDFVHLRWELAQGIAVACGGLLVLTAAIIVWRRLAGALARPLDPAVLWLVGMAVAAAAVTIRIAGRYGRGEQRARPLERSMAATLSVAVLALGVALSLPGSSIVGLVAFWGVLAAEEGWAWAPAGWRRVLRWRARAKPPKPMVRIDQPELPRPHVEGFEPGPGAPPTGAPPTRDVIQQQTRTREADGKEALSGWLRVPMAAGQRSANVHVAFCPPFARSPDVTVEQIEGPEARIKTAQVLPYAARFDLKLSAFCETPATVLIRFSAQAAPPARPSPEPGSPRTEDSSGP